MTIKPLVFALPLVLAGCGFLGLGSKPQPELVTRTYASAYPGLTDKSVAIVVYTPSAVINEYSGAREEISAFVATQMRGHMPTTRLLDPVDVINWQDGKMNWASLSPRDIGRHFGVDRVLTIEVLDYSTKRPLVVSNLQGRLRAQCRIYDTADAAPGPDANGHMEPVWTGLVDAAWPSGKPLDPTQTNEAAVRLRALDTFADQLVRYFYEAQAADTSIRG
jgi:hypothetical protein